MKHPIVYSALYASILSIIAKMSYFIWLAPSEDWSMYTRFFYLLCFLAALFFGLRTWKLQQGQGDFAGDMKTSMKIASIYALVISSFTWLYYKWIDPSYFEGRRAEAISSAASSGADETQLENVTNTVAFIFDPFTHATITLFGYIAIGLFYSIVVVLLFRARPRAFGLPRQ
jgi:hypothetical protein